MNKDVLVVEISGKRPGDKNKRPTEKFDIKYDKVIISNNSDGYETEWPLINVPKEYEEWYKKNIKSSENAYYAPMNRSYAIKYAKQHGYKYLIQLDDNIVSLKIGYIIEKKYNNYKIAKQYSSQSTINNKSDMINDFIDIMIETLNQTNAGIVGLNMQGASMPGSNYLSERFCYSFFGLKLDVIPEIFQGDFEDDIEFRLKLNQMNIPSVQIAPLFYGKTAQQVNKDLTGCRAEYLKAGVKRGEHMKKLYGDIYSAGISSRTNKAGKQQIDDKTYFRHKIKPIKIGIIIKDRSKIDEKLKNIFKKYTVKKDDSIKIWNEKEVV